MREHAIPQDITGYRFHIIGNMTLKQFAEIGAGCVVGFLFYTTNLPTIVKWPLIGLSIGLGALVAFVPVEERPLDHWVTTFFKVLYKPTKFFWRRTPRVPEAFNYTPLDHVVNEQQETDFRPARKERIKEYLRSVEPAKAIDQFDWSRLQQIDSIMATFDQTVVNNPTVQANYQKPDLKVRVRSMTPNPYEETGAAQAIDQTNDTSVGIGQDQLNAAIDQATSQTDEYSALAANRELNRQAGLQTYDVAANMQIPEVENISIKPVTEQTQPEDAYLGNQQQGTYVQNVAPVAPAPTGQSVTMNADLPFPMAPTEPNKVVGMCTTPQNEIISGAIVEIQTQDGQVARAVKTNSLGQFFVTTPLENGLYVIIVEKDGYQFAPMSLEINGSVLPPLDIRSA